MAQCEMYDPIAEFAREHVVKMLRGSHKWLQRFLTGIPVEYVEHFEGDRYTVIMKVNMSERKAHEVGELLKELRRRAKHAPNGAWMQLTKP